MSSLQDLQKQVDTLTSQNTSLSQQLSQAQSQLNAVMTQCKASKQCIDELTNANIVLRTNLLLQQEHSQRREEVIKQLSEAQLPVTPVKETKAA